MEEIIRFKQSYPQYFTMYYKAHLFTANVVQISKDEYLKNKDKSGLIYDWNKVEKELIIIAPLDQMNMTNKQLNGYQIIDMPKDPILLLPLKENGVDLFVVITKWGDEAFHPDLIEPSMN